MSAFWQYVIGLAAMLAGAWLLPLVGMRALVPSLESAPRLLNNYRGRPVFLGLGIVWVFWGIGVYLFALVTRGAPIMHDVRNGVVAQVLPVALVLLFGLIDDAFGSSAERGLGGHLRALLHGRLTTGALKLFGIALAAALASIGVISGRGIGADHTALYFGGIVAGTVLIAGSANLLNLLDLRPGRALKSYGFLVAFAWLVMAASALVSAATSFSWIELMVLAVALAGPVLAIWRFDVRERGMLGDAGANAAGALAGIALAMSLPLWGIAVAALVIVAANFASERVSFSQVIARNGVLSWLDGLGRSPADVSTTATLVSDDTHRNGPNDG